MAEINTTKNTINNARVTVAYGDGIGPEIMEPVIDILKHAGSRVHFDSVEIGENYYKKGYTSGIPDSAWDIIKKNRIFLKAPITTPQGGGYKSLNVTLRKALSLYANVRPCLSYYPYVETKCPNIDVVIVRENEEDLYAGVEYRQTRNCYQALKIITHRGCEKIIRYAFEYAKKNGRKKVTCMTKDNIMKIADGIFHKIFDQVALEYPDIENEHYIIDIGAARLATKPEIFDVIVTLNLYGDIISDIVAEVAGSVGLAGSGNIGDKYAMFEAIHGSAPKMVGQDRANPSGLLNGAIMMLSFMGQGSVANKIHNALMYTLESGVHTTDIYKEGISKKQVGCRAFAEEIIKNLGKAPSKLPSAQYKDFDFDSTIDLKSKEETESLKWIPFSKEKKDLVGCDIFIDYEGNAQEFGDKIAAVSDDILKLKLCSARGLKVYPGEAAHRTISDHWRCRFVAIKDGQIIDKTYLAKFFVKLVENGFDIIQTENLYNFDGNRSYALAQGE